MCRPGPRLDDRRTPARALFEEETMRRSIITGVVLGIVVLWSTPALAAPPEVSQKNCDAAGGSFDRDHGVKSCTTTSVDTVTSEHAGPRQSMSFGGGLVTVDYTGMVREADIVRSTTTQTQKGNGDVTTSSDSVLLSWSYEWLTCHVDADYFGASFSRNVDPDVCAHPQNYPPDSLFG
jgi:hypothetical protein